MNDPLVLLANDRSKARAANDPWAALCVLATVDALGEAQARVVILRDLEARLAVFINGTSPKQAETRFAARQAVLIYLASLGVQYRLTVAFEPVPREIVRHSWLDRPRIPKVMDWLYERIRPQSSAVPSREYLSERFADLDAELPTSVEAPQHALGYYLNVERVERLELASDRIHSRRRFERNGASWTMTELVP